MIRTRIATTAALVTFGLASLGGIVVAIAAPANADTDTTTVDGTAMTGTAGQAVNDAREVPTELAEATRGAGRRQRPHPRQHRHRRAHRLPRTLPPPTVSTTARDTRAATNCPTPTAATDHNSGQGRH